MKALPLNKCTEVSACLGVKSHNKRIYCLAFITIKHKEEPEVAKNDHKELLSGKIHAHTHKDAHARVLILT